MYLSHLIVPSWLFMGTLRTYCVPFKGTVICFVPLGTKLYLHCTFFSDSVEAQQASMTCNVSVTYVTLVPWRRERRRHVGWPTKLGSRQRDQSTSSVTKRANGHWHAIIASSCRWSPCEYKRQQVHRINSCFRWGAEPETRQLSGGTATVATGRDVSVPSFRERGLHT